MVGIGSKRNWLDTNYLFFPGRGNLVDVPQFQGMVDIAPIFQGVVDDAPTIQGVVDEPSPIQGMVDDAPTIQGVVDDAPPFQGVAEDAPLGRVHVEDPDDWDVEDKVRTDDKAVDEWVRLFSLSSALESKATYYKLI